MPNVESVVNDFSNLLSEADTLLKRASTETGEQARALQAQVESKLLTAKLRLQEIEGRAIESAKAMSTATDTYVHENRWQAVGIPAAVGFLAGALITRR